MAKKIDEAVPKLYAVLHDGKKIRFIIPAWQYHSIVLELQFAGIERQASYDIARRITRLRDEELIPLGKLSLSVERRLI